MDFQQYYESRKKLVNNFLEKRMEKRGISNVDDAMKYSLLAGGKRLRPILLMATAEAVGANGYDYLPVACGLEMIHTFSLIHDDLPCMDNDDYRRGRLTNHKVYGEAMALLAGDGLFALAFGFFGTIAGFMQAAEFIQMSADISPNVIWGGVKVGLIPTAYGIIVYLVSLILRVIKKPRI